MEPVVVKLCSRTNVPLFFWTRWGDSTTYYKM